MATQKKIHIISFTNCPLDPALGSGKTVVNYTRQLKNCGHRVEVFAPDDYEFLQNMGRMKKFRQAIGAWLLWQLRLKNKKIDVIEYYGDEFWLLAVSLRLLYHRPLLVAHTNGLELLAREMADDRVVKKENFFLTGFKDRLLAGPHRYFSRLAFRSADCFVALCKLDVDYIINHHFLPARKTMIVGPGLDHEYLSRSQTKDRPKKVAFNGSWISRKGIMWIVPVMINLLSKHVWLEFDVFGSGEHAASVHAYFPENLRSRIHVHPRMTTAKLADKLGESRAFFFPSVYEGYGMATAEAMARGCVPVVTPTGYGAELQSGVQGFVCPFGDLSGMANALEQILLDDECFQRMSNNARNYVKDYQWEFVGKILSDVYMAWYTDHKNHNTFTYSII